MAKRFTDTEKYKKAFMRNLPGPYKLFWDYLYHDCNHAGIWNVDFEIAQIYLGQDMKVDPETALKHYNEGEERVKVLENGKKWFIIPFIPFQYGQLTPTNNMHRPIILTLVKLGLRSPLEAPTVGAQYTDKEKEDVVVKGSMRGKRFTPPTLQAVVDFAGTEGLGLDAKKFFNHYESKGWMVGRNGMKDWKAAARLAAGDWAKINSGSGGIPEWMKTIKAS